MPLFPAETEGDTPEQKTWDKTLIQKTKSTFPAIYQRFTILKASASSFLSSLFGSLSTNFRPPTIPQDCYYSSGNTLKELVWETELRI